MPIIDPIAAKRTALEIELREHRMQAPFPTAEAIRAWNRQVAEIEAQLDALPETPEPRAVAANGMIAGMRPDSIIVHDSRLGINFPRPIEAYEDDDESDHVHDYDPYAPSGYQVK